MSVANIIHTRHEFNRQDYDWAKIVASSGFDLFKCRIMNRARAPIDYVGTGSFIPDTLKETFATADIFEYDGNFLVKVGRENLFAPYAGMEGAPKDGGSESGSE